jgi:hypothetical protein
MYQKSLAALPTLRFVYRHTYLSTFDRDAVPVAVRFELKKFYFALVA